MSETQRFDLHVHSRHSPDSRNRVGELVEQAGICGMQGFALTDHNSIGGHARLRELGTRFPRLLLIPGVEVSTQEGHLLVYGADGLPPAHRPIAETIEWADSHGGIPVLAHPFRWAHGVGRSLAESARVPAIETVNGHNAILPNARAALVAARRFLGETGGSDTHNLTGLGRGYTEFPDGVESVEDVLEALRRGRCRAAGRSLTGGERWSVALATLGRRVARGFRPI